LLAHCSRLHRTTLNQQAYAQGGSVAEEVISSIRNTTAFNTQERLARQYDSYLERAEVYGRRLQASLGTLIALMMTFVYLNYSLSFWQGSRFLVKGEVDVSQVLTVLFAGSCCSSQLENLADRF
jgi:ATP-binding cassette subfamily B (MDR/TAP) protein 1